MINFRSFPKIKILLRAAALTGLILNLQGVWARDYTWKNTVTSGNWTDSANWTPSTGYPGQNSADTASFTGSSEITVTLDSDLTVSGLNFNTAGSSKITVNLNSKKLTCSGDLILVDATSNNRAGNVELTGNGELQTQTFDFPNQGSNEYEHTFVIGPDDSSSSTTLTITKTLWANSEKKLTFSGTGYLYMPNGGGNVDYGPSNITYNIESTRRRPYTGGEATYTCTTSVQESSPNGATVIVTKANYTSVSGAQSVRFPMTVEIVGNASYSLNGTPLTNGNYTGNSPATNGNSPINVSYNGSPATYTLSCSATSFSKGDGIRIIFYSPDGYNPSDSFMELGRITWYYQTPTWTGAGSNRFWTNTDNWIGLTGISDIRDLKDYDIEISQKDLSKTPVINDNVSVKSLTITTGSKVTLQKGTFSTEKIETAGIGSSFTWDDSDPSYGGIVELRKSTSYTEPLKYAFNDTSTISIKTLSIGESLNFSMPVDMNLTMLILNSGCTFSKNGHNLSLGWLQAQTSSYSSPANKNITLSDSFEADCIIFLLRDGNININENLTARKDIIIAGPNYNSSAFKYQHFTSRPSGWVQSFTKTSLDITSGDPVSSSSTLSIAAGKSLTAGTSGKGNFYINGATLTGSSGNSLVIPPNDSPENFCAEVVNSTISNITVTCADGTSDGSHAQIPATDCSLTGCTNFDSQEFGISSATTVSDNRIYLKFPRPIRKITYPSAIKTSDGTGFTAEYASETGSDAPANPKSSLYLYTANTTWNTDASGTSAGSGNYTNSKGEYRTVIPYLVIPQYITDSSGNVTCGYVITDKWGKRLKAYAPDASAFKDVTDGIPEDKKKKREPPAFSISLSPVSRNEIVIGFTKPVVTSSSKISYYTDASTRIPITQSMEELLPLCFQLFSIDSSGNAHPSDLQIDRNQRAVIKTSSQGLSSVTMRLTKKVTLSDVENLYIRLVAPKDAGGNPLYPPTTYDHQTGLPGLPVSFIQKSDTDHTKDGTTYMALNTAHTISDFAVGAVTPSHAYNSGTSDGGENIASAYHNIYGEGSSAVHDFSKNQKNYGTLSYGTEFTLVSKAASEINSLKLLISDSPDSDSRFTVFNTNFDSQSEAWLANLDGKIFDSYSTSLNSNYYTSVSDKIKSANEVQGFNFIVAKDQVSKMKTGSQLSFLFAIADASNTPLQHILTPVLLSSDAGTYDLSKSISYPLFAFNLSNSSDLLSLSPWYITLKSITEQRGGVTILNNVINAAAGEKTVLKVNMPSSGNLDIMIMTIDGNIVKYLAHGNAGAGEHFYYWDGRNNAGSEVARGMYFVIIKGPGIDENRKVMVVK